jgi:phosphatidylserine/phosphatidylglycerophosphate/cardiolipin synthase-like enzyme
MHAKVILAKDSSGRWSAFGSYNLNPTSRWFNQELLMFANDADLWNALDERWHDILAEPWCKA